MPRSPTFDTVTAESGQQIPDALVRDLIGSADDTAPASGLVSEINTAISDGFRYLNIRGAWTMGGELSITSANYVPFGITLDATGAYIEYGGSGWAITNDNSGGLITEQRDGGILTIKDGVWEATGTPNGLFLGKDVTFNVIDYPRVLNFTGSTNQPSGSVAGSAIVQLEIVDRWCEANWIGFKSYPTDVGVRGVRATNSSMQDNILHNVHCSQLSEVGFDWSGNWIDCSVINPTFLVQSEDAAAIYHNGVAQGTEIVGMELENPGGGLSNFYVYRMGPDGGDAPIIRGGDWDSNTQFIDKSNEGGSPSWKAHIDYADGQNRVWINFRNGANPQKLILSQNGLELESNSVDDGSGTWTTDFSAINGGNVTGDESQMATFNSTAAGTANFPKFELNDSSVGMFMAGGEPALVRSGNDGVHYPVPLSARPNTPVSVVSYIDDGTGTNAAGLYLTTDGGTNWTQL